MGGLTLAEMTAEIRAVNIEKGWRPAGGGPGANTWGDYIALLHSEISEALEAYRDHRLNDSTLLRVAGGAVMPKPEGVGSEFADILIRLVDMMDVFGKPLPGTTIAEIVGEWPAASVEILLVGEGFGGWMAWLHHWADKLWMEPVSGMRWVVGQQVLAALGITAQHFGIDLEAEYVRKIAYNRTRAFQHGGRTLGEDRPARAIAPAQPIDDGQRQAFNMLFFEIPTDPRDWWTGEEIENFLVVWKSQGLPRITMYDGQGETVMLWCADVRRAAEMLGMSDNVTNDESFSISKGEYVASIVQAEEKETKDA